MFEKKTNTDYGKAWQTLFDNLPPAERLQILQTPSRERAAEHARQAYLLSIGAEKDAPAIEVLEKMRRGKD